MRKDQIVLILFFCLIILAVLMIHVPYCMAEEEISPAILNQLVSSIYKKPEKLIRRNLIGDQYPEILGKCATPIINMALAHPDWLDEENYFILFRPDNPAYIRYYAPDRSVTWTYDTPEGHFKIHYSESGTHAVFGSDGIQSTIPDYVISFGSYFEEAWYYETDPNMLGYNPPPPDGNNGGDSRLDVYIKDINYYGYTDDQVGYGHPYIVVHNNYTVGFESNLDPEGARAGNMKITAAHEFFHAIQYFYVDWLDSESIWWEENTAVWMEDEVFDYVNGYLNYIGNPFDDLNGNLKWDSGEPWYDYNGNHKGIYGRPGDIWFEAPHVSLDTRETPTFTRYEYGGVMWAKYQAARFGADFIKDSFIIIDSDTEALTAIRQALQDYGSSLENEFFDFRVKVLTLDTNIFEEGENYPLVRHEGNYGNYPIGLDLGEGISHLSCRYIGLKPPSGEWKLVIEIDGEDYSHFGVALVLFSDTGYEIRDIPIEYLDEQVGRIEVGSFGTEGIYKRATIIPMNLSSNQDYRSIDIHIYLDGMCDVDLDNDGVFACNDCNDNNAEIYPGNVESCDGRDNDCDGFTDEDFNLLTDPNNCGICDYICPSYPHADRLCINGNCILGLCNPGWQNLDDDPNNGCESPEISIEIKLSAEWSMISLPVLPKNATVSSVFPEAEVVYGFEKELGYLRVKKYENLQAGKGYWILVYEDQNYVLTGQPILSYQKRIYEDGWEMIGGCSSSAKALVNNCHKDVIYSYIYGTGYQRLLESDNLEPGKGYWSFFSNVTDQAQLNVCTTDICP